MDKDEEKMIDVMGCGVVKVKTKDCLLACVWAVYEWPLCFLFHVFPPN